MDDGDNHTDILEKSRFEIVQRLQLDRPSLFDYLRSKRVFDESDCEIILSEKTREQKASKFVDILQTKGKDGLIYFQDILQLLNPGLYESITGKRANPCRIWESMRERFVIGNCSPVPDVELLSGQLKRTIDDLQELALRNQQLIKENQNLGMKLDQASNNLDLKHRRVEALEKQRNSIERGVLEAHSNANRLSECVTQHLRLLQQGLFERNTYIIALQMKLLATEEEIKETRKTQEELRAKNDMLLAKWEELSKNYDYERRESMKLSAKLKSQIGNLQKAGEFERKYKEFKQINQKMMAERDESLCELEDLKHWSEALKARYDLVDQEYQQLQQNFASTAAENCKLKEETEELKLQLSLSNIRVSDLKSWNEDLEETVKQYREQRDYFTEARNAALNERDETYRELEACVSRCQEKISERETMLSRQTEHAKQFEDKYEKACNEVKTLQQRLVILENQLEEIRLKRAKANSCATQTADSVDNGEENPKMPSESDLNIDSVDKFEEYPWKHRRNVKEIMQSLRKRVTGQRLEACSLDRCLDMLKFDGSLSQEARKCISHQRGNLLFKTPPTYSLLRAVFGLSVGGHSDSLPDLSSDHDATDDLEYTSTDSMTDDDELGTFEKPTDLECNEAKFATEQLTAVKDSVGEPKLHRCFTKSHSSPEIQIRIPNEFTQSQEEKPQDDEDGEFHVVKEDECEKNQNELGVNDKILKRKKGKYRPRSPVFRQRAWAIRKKGQRSSSEPGISYQGRDDEIPTQETTDG